MITDALVLLGTPAQGLLDGLALPQKLDLGPTAEAIIHLLLEGSISRGTSRRLSFRLH